jgi:hypothetical protein
VGKFKLQNTVTAQDPDQHFLYLYSVPYTMIADLKHVFFATFEAFIQCSLHFLKIENFEFFSRPRHWQG